MKHYGDITKISGYRVPSVNVVIGGSPCQDLSVAGKRAGLAGERSGLFTEQIRLIKEMRLADEQRGNSGGCPPPLHGLGKRTGSFQLQQRRRLWRSFTRNDQGRRAGSPRCACA